MHTSKCMYVCMYVNCAVVDRTLYNYMLNLIMLWLIVCYNCDAVMRAYDCSRANFAVGTCVNFVVSVR